MHTLQSLSGDLYRMGVNPAGTVLVHSSMRSIGPVKGGAGTVLDALGAYMQKGLLVLPGLTWNIAQEEAPLFHVLESAPIVGLLPRLFWQRPGVVRSWHPTHSLCARGRDAVPFTADDHRSGTPCGRVSGWHKLLDRDATILMVGCTLTSCTFLHGVEEWSGIPGRLTEIRDFRVKTPDGGIFTMPLRTHIGTYSENYWRAEPALRAVGALVDGTLGDAPVMVLSARGTYDTVTALLQDDPDLFGDITPN